MVERTSAIRFALARAGVLFELCLECFNLAPLPQRKHKFSLMRFRRIRRNGDPDRNLKESD